MSREIKFRAWDKELKKLFEVSQLDFSDWWVQCKIPIDAPKENGGAFYGERNSFKNEETDRHILMQYTGVKDCENNEIYEGDIVQFYNDEDYILKQGKAVICFDLGAFCMKHFKYGTETLGDMDIDEMFIKVIGNIYENPELLKE